MGCGDKVMVVKTVYRYAVYYGHFVHTYWSDEWQVEDVTYYWSSS